LLGTVIGMIFAFMVTSQDAAVGSQAAQLGKGIYLALLTTAAGLTIAIPCLLLAARFDKQVEQYMRVMNETLLSTMGSFLRLEREAKAVSQENDDADTPLNDEVRVPVSAK
jgi:biopolymer transport protein ExbB